MNKILLLCSLIAGLTFNAQVTGSKTIGVDYTTLDAAFADLNATGVGVGGATINVPAGYTETAPASGFMLGSATLNATLSNANQLFVQKMGAGINPLFTAQVGTVDISTANLIGDAIFNFSGVDYMTIDGLDLKESFANTDATTLVEKGFAFYNLSAVDGSKFNTIKNCTITFLKTVNNTATGIYFGHYLYGVPATAISPTNANGTHSNNKIYSNAITKSMSQAISFTGFAAANPALNDQNNDIGGYSLATGNTITNFGGMVNGRFFITNLAIVGLNQKNANISNNIIQFESGGMGTVGIQISGNTTSSTINHNTIDAVGQTYYVNQEISAHGGIVIPIGSSGLNITANFNKINISATLYDGAVGISGITSSATGSFNADHNIIVGGSNTASFYGILTVGTTGVNISNNDISGLASIGESSIVSGIHLPQAWANMSISGNKIYNLTANAAGGKAYGIYVAGGTAGSTVNIFNNLIGDLKSPLGNSDTVSLAGIYLRANGTNSKMNVYYNTIYLKGISTGANFNSTGIYHTNYATATTAALDLRNNIIINNSTSNGTGNASAFRRSEAGVSNYAATSNNNDFYATDFVYWNGTSGNTLAELQALTRDANSHNINAYFLNTVGSNVDFLKLNPADLTTQSLDNKGAPTAGYTLDYAAVTRDATTPDMGAYEFTYVAPSTVPDCTVVSSPADLTTGIVPNPTVLSWSAAARATSYKLSIGSAAGLSDILSVTGLRALSYNVPLLANTKYFATVIATNNIGDATGCTEISFTIGGWVYCSITSSAPAAIAPITSVDFGGVSNTSDANATTLGRFTAYQDFTSTEFSIANNRTSVPLTITGITTASSGHGWGMSVFIDWNNDGVFAGTEEQYFNTFATKVFVNGSTNNSVTLTGNITIPSGVSLGKKRMRVKYNFQNTDATTLGATLLTACANMVNGQTEDYTINYEIFLPVSNAIKAAVSVYPNPFQDVLKISDIKGVKSISINDVSGRQVKNMKPFSELDLSGLKTGLYIVILHMEDGTVKSIKAIKK